MKSFLKLMIGFALGGVAAVMAELAPMIVPAILCVLLAVIVIDCLADEQSAP